MAGGAIVAASLVAEIIAKGAEDSKKQVENFGKATKDAGDKTDETHKKIAGWVKAAALIGGAAGAAIFLKDQLSEALQAADDQQNAVALMNNALTATHDVSGQTTASLEALASSTADYTTYSKQATEAAETQLLAFTNVRQNFTLATKSAQDLAAGMKIDLSSAAAIVGRAFDNPKNAARSLRQAHITLTQAQSDLIAKFDATGNVMGAQNVIAQALADRYGGAAKAAGSTLAGQQEILTHKIEESKEAIGEDLQPAMAALTSFIADKLMPKVTELVNFLTTHKPVLIATAVVIGGAMVVAFTAWAISAASAAVATIAATWPLLLVVAAVALVVGGIVLLVKHFDLVRNAVGLIPQAFKEAFELAYLFASAPMEAIIKGVNFIIRAINGIKFTVPSWVPGLGGKGVAFNIPQVPDLPGYANGSIPGLASGGTITKGGTVLVGENGPEYLRLPGGAQVRPLGAGGGGDTYNIYPAKSNFTAEDMADIQRRRQKLGRVA